MVNDGRRRGFLYCRDCGYAELTPLRQPKRSTAGQKQHIRPSASAITCGGMLTRINLGHVFMTDIVEFMFPSLPMPTGTKVLDGCNSIISALIQGAARTLNARRQDIAGTFYFDGGSPVFVLYDDVPGGAGLANAAHSRIIDVVSAAVTLCEGCTCGETSSCYGCLRTYSNQFEHEDLDRSMVTAAFQPLLVAAGAR